MEIQATGDTSAENMQVLQVLLELVHPQGGTVQIERGDNDNIQIEGEQSGQLPNVSSLASELANENIVISYNGVESTLGSIQNQIQQHQLEAAAAVAASKPQESAEYGSQFNDNVVFQITRQAEDVSIPISTVATPTAPRSSIVEIPIVKNATLAKQLNEIKTKEKEKPVITMEELEKKYTYECSLCQKLCKSERSLAKHMQKELKVKPYVCNTCNKRFKNAGGLQNHQKLHTGEKPFKCQTCDIAFTNRSTYNYHNERKHSDKVYVCQCGKNFKTKACLRAHLKNHHYQGPKRYKCQFCGLRLRTLHYKNEHERIHTNERPFKCREGCEKGFKRSGARNDHERTVHLKLNKEPCKYCGHLYNKREIKNHEMVHTGEKPFECPYCESRYTQRKVLNKHITRKHPGEEIIQPPHKEKVTLPPPIVKHTEPKPKKLKKKHKIAAPPVAEAEPLQPETVQIQVYKCMYCVKLFNNIDHLAEHEKTHVQEAKYACSTCGKSFKRPEGLTRHEGKHAGGFQCPTCAKWFNTMTKMQTHQREHFEKCDLCRLKFQTKEELEEHMKKHKSRKYKSDTNLPKRTHECKYCNKSFLRQIGLKEHERVHVEKVKCPLCNKAFVSYYLQKHLRTHSGDHPYTCTLCPDRHYTTPNALRTHMVRRHPVHHIEIRHDKGNKKATIAVSEKDSNLETLTAEVITDVTSNIPEDATISITEDVTSNVPKNVTRKIHKDVTNNINKDVTADVTSNVTEDVDEAGDEPLPTLEEIPNETETPGTSLHMEVIPESDSEEPSIQMEVVPTTSDESDGSKLMTVPISIANVIQQAAAANDIQIDTVVAPNSVVTQRGQVAQLVHQDGTITTMAIGDTLSQTEQQTIISDMDTENGGDSQTEQETIIMREIDADDETMAGGDEQIVFTFE